MPFLLKDTIHRSLVDTVYNEFVSRRSNYYYFIGNIMEWGTPGNPNAPEPTDDYEYYTRNGILSVKKINLRDVSYVVPRVNWSSGTVYDQYDGNYSTAFPSYSGATKLKEANFYVLTSTYGVYKCIFNNNDAPSTEEPFGQDITTLSTSDGYVWKYLYTIPLSAQNRFLTQDYMPVQRAVTNAYYSKGEISSVIIDNAGSGYSGNSEVALNVSGQFLGGTGNSIANLRPILNTAGEFISIIIDAPGNNYKTATINITDSGGQASSHNKGVSNVKIFNPGSNYFTNVTANTTVAILTSGSVQPASNAQANLIFSSNQLVDIVITNPGSQYSNAAKANTAIVISTSGNVQPTTNATANLFFANTAILTPVLANGQIQSVLIVDQGKGYSSNVQTVLTVTGDGTGAVLTPFVNTSGQIEDIIIEQRGNGYTYLNIEVVGAGSNANAYATLSVDDLDTLQTVVELSAVKGGIHAFRVSNAGSGYTYANVTIVGDGEGLTSNVVLENNTISYISVFSPGAGYNYANVTVTGNGSNANVSAILSPPGGHGSDPVRELFADTLMFTSTINNEKNHGVNVLNDYRQFGILKDIKKFGNGQSFTSINGSACLLLTLSSAVGISRDDILSHYVDSSKRYYDVVEVINGTNQILVQSKNNHTVGSGDVLIQETSNTAYTISIVNNVPDINKFSGDLLYIDNRTAVSYSAQQLVTLRTVIKL